MPDTVNRRENFPQRLSGSEFTRRGMSEHMLVAGARTRMFFALKIFKLDGCENVRRNGQDRKLPLTLV